MKIACNQPYKLSLSRWENEVYFLDSQQNVDVIVLLLANVFGNNGVAEMRRLLEEIKKYPTTTPCYLLGVLTCVPDRNFKKYASKIRDDVIRDLLDEVLSRSNVVGVSNQITKEWLVEYFNYPEEKVQVVFSQDQEKTRNLLNNFARANETNLPICWEDVYWYYEKRSVLQKSLFSTDFKKDVIISRPFLEFCNDEKVKYCANITIDNQTIKLWLETDRSLEKYLLLDRCDAFLFGLLPYAIRFNHNIVCEGPITEQFYHNITEILLPHLINYDKRLYDISIIADTTNVFNRGHAVGTAVSGGVDSFYSVYQYYKCSKTPSMQLTHLYVGNYLYGGEGKKVINERAKKIADDLSLPLVMTDTNISVIFEKYINHLYYHAYKTFFGVISLRNLWNTYYYASSSDFSHFSVEGAATDSTSKMDLLLVDVVSVPGFRAYSGGCKASRYEKTKALTNFPVTYNHLNVCLNPRLEKNCSKCGKCIRTMLNLDMCNALEKYREVFDVDYYRENQVNIFEFLITEKENIYMKDAYEYFLVNEPKKMRIAQENLDKKKTDN